MDSNGSVLEHLSPGECMRLLRSVPLGRIVYTRQAMPAVEVVNFALAGDGDIVIRAEGGGKLATAVSGAVVAFEADNADVVAHTGWSVTVVGYARVAVDLEEISRLERLALTPWAPGNHDHFLLISPAIVSGRRVRHRWLAGSGDARRPPNEG
ncbi:MAG TPA: pyridoxamine 5'-phosphate oxidase family protein [Trebonia sp.]|nr:pyridoxamine 5'-phosphate oxidase family protein [Trebonia sp.]